MGISLWQVLIVVVLVFLLFGAGRLPRVMEDIAKGIKSFKKGISEDDVIEPQKISQKDKEES
jgi:sec-independent protein translocase protein TatA